MAATNGSTLLRWTLGVIGTAALAVILWLCSSAFGQESKIVGLEKDGEHVRERLDEIRLEQRELRSDVRDGFRRIEKRLEDM